MCIVPKALQYCVYVRKVLDQPMVRPDVKQVYCTKSITVLFVCMYVRKVTDQSGTNGMEPDVKQVYCTDSITVLFVYIYIVCL